MLSYRVIRTVRRVWSPPSSLFRCFRNCILGVLALAADANLRGMPELEHHAIFRLTLVDPSMTYSAPVDTPLGRSQKGILIRAEL